MECSKHRFRATGTDLWRCSKLQKINWTVFLHFRDDACRLWKAIATLIQEVVTIHYKLDDDVTNDTELQAWIWMRMAFLWERATSTSITSFQGTCQCVTSLFMFLPAWCSRVRVSMPPWPLDWWMWQASLPTLHRWCASHHQRRKMRRLWSQSWIRFLASLSLLTRLLWCMCCHNLPRTRWERSIEKRILWPLLANIPLNIVHWLFPSNLVSNGSWKHFSHTESKILQGDD